MTEPPNDLTPPIDPLDDVAWARVERGLWSRMDADATPSATGRLPARARWVAPALAALAAVAAAAAITLVVTRGRVADPLADRHGRSRIVTDAAASTITFDDVHLAVAADSAIVFDHDARAPSALVERGAAWFTVAPRGDRPRFVVRAGDATVEVVGTRFRVARTGERVEVEVDHGRVNVTFRGTALVLGTHEAWASESRTPTPTPIPTADPDRARFTALGAIEARDPSAAIAGYLELSAHATPWAELALFAAGRLAADRHDPRAATLLANYLDRFPAGANAADARQLLARIDGITH